METVTIEYWPDAFLSEDSPIFIESRPRTARVIPPEPLGWDMLELVIARATEGPVDPPSWSIARRLVERALRSSIADQDAAMIFDARLFALGTMNRIEQYHARRALREQRDLHPLEERETLSTDSMTIVWRTIRPLRDDLTVAIDSLCGQTADVSDSKGAVFVGPLTKIAAIRIPDLCLGTIRYFGKHPSCCVHDPDLIGSLGARHGLGTWGSDRSPGGKYWMLFWAILPRPTALRVMSDLSEYKSSGSV